MSVPGQPPIETPEPAGNGPGGLFRSGPLAESLGVYLPATVAFRLINFGRILLLSWYMLQQQFGLFTMILLVVNVMTPLCSFGLNDAVTRYVPQHEARGTLAAMVRRSVILLMGVTVLTLAPIFIFGRHLGGFLYTRIISDSTLLDDHARHAVDLARVSAIVIALLAFYFFLLSVLKGLRMFTALSLMEIMHGGLFLALSIGAIALGEPQALTLTWLYALSLVVPIALCGLGLQRVLSAWTGQHGAIDGGGVGRTLLGFGFWATLAGGTWQIMVYFPAWYLNKVHGNDAVAVFAAVRQIGQFVLIGAVALVAIVMSNVAKTWETRGREEADRQLSLAFRGCCLGLFFGCVLVALAKDLIIR
ncbi:MAG: oligosaccharide flippase family protein, partial [Planctomycetota bacterium]|nr:oligosaccharide flippase family protein [Planctomycetota bacterium]